MQAQHHNDMVSIIFNCNEVPVSHSTDENEIQFSKNISFAIQIASTDLNSITRFFLQTRAMQIQSLTTQTIYVEQVVVNKQIKPSIIEISGIKFRFIYHNPMHFFGNKETWIDNFNKVKCSDLEKTLVDDLFKPDYAGE